MVLLIPSVTLISALQDYNNLSSSSAPFSSSSSLPEDSDQPSLEPIQHDPPPVHLDHHTIQKISAHLIAHATKSSSPENASKYRLNRLLQGCEVYIPPKPPKPEPTEEYKSLMAHLRARSEAASYRSMLSSDSSHLPFPDSKDDDEEEDEYTLKHLKSDLSLIANVLFSILATGGAVWAVASSWPVPSRFALAFAASIVVGVAEVVVLKGYYRRIEEARGTEKRKVERKVVLRSWEVGAGRAEGDGGWEAEEKAEKKVD